jgi:CHAT domain-containing protein/tetratricopeptide (TPR) repeat protein
MLVAAVALGCGSPRAPNDFVEEDRARFAEVRQALDAGQYQEAEELAVRLTAARESQFGSSSLQVARALDQQLEATLRSRGAAAREIVTLAERAIRLKQQHLPEDDADLAISVQNLASVFTERAEYTRAVVEARRALAIRRRAFPASDPLIADSLNALALPLIQAERFAEAREALDESLWIWQQGQEGSGSIATARTAFLQALLHRYDGDYRRATEALEKSFAFWQRTNPNHPDVLALLQVRGDLHFLAGDLGEAERVWSDALVRVQKLLGPAHPSVPRLLNGLGMAAQQSGNLEQARVLQDQALGIAERALAPCHPLLPILMNDLGSLTSFGGRYEVARGFFARALSTSERCLGANHSLTATTVHNTANLAVTMGDLARAETLHRRAVDAWSTTLGPDHPYVARGLDSLAEVMTLQGRQREAEAVLERALSVRQKALGPTHPDVAGSLVTLARAKAASGQVPLAIRQVREAVAIYGRGGRPQEPDYLAAALLLLGDLEARQGNQGQARGHFTKAKELRASIFGVEHPLTAEATAQLAAADFAGGVNVPAFTSSLDAERVGRDHLRFTIRYLPERQALAYAAKRPRGLDLALSIAATGRAPDVPAAFDSVIRSRGVILDELAARARTAAADDPAVAALLRTVTAARERFANLMFRSTGGESVTRERLDAARQEKEEAERALAERSAEARAENTRASVGFDEIRRALPADTALVSFVRYDRTLAGPGRRTSSRNVPSYVAFVVSAGTRALHIVPIGEAASVQTAVENWRYEVDGRSLVKGGFSAASGRAYGVAGTALRRQIWDPLKTHFGAAARVFIVPDGAINLVSFPALPTGESRYLVDDGPVLHLLSAERDLVLSGKAPTGRGLLAVGGPSYDLAPAAKAATQPVRRSGCGSFDTLQFEDLPGALAEVQDIARIWAPEAAGKPSASSPNGVTVLSGQGASESAVARAAAGRRIVHLATHGFFLDSICDPKPPDTRGVGGLTSREPTASTPDRAENPLLFTGLALAGANRGSSVPVGSDDGILTAEEVSSLNLQGTEWAVLSACDTGLGQIQAGEGVFGLRRAFQIAGAATVIMSLWSVEDQPTRLWMRALYEARLRQGASTAAAVQQAARAVLQSRRSQGQSTHPFYWAAFVAAGDWR